MARPPPQQCEAALKPSSLFTAPVLALALAWAPGLTTPGAAVASPATPARAATDGVRLAEHAWILARRVVPAAPAVAAARPAAPGPRPAPRPAARPVRHHRLAAAPRLSPVERAKAAYASLHLGLPSGWTISFRPYNGRYQGLSSTVDNSVIICPRQRDTRQELRITIAHELGHVLDFTTLTSADRQRYLALRGRSGFSGHWYPSNGTSDYASPAGDFAEVFALWAAGPGDFRSTFAPKPSRERLAQIAQLFRELRARQH